MPPLPLEFIQSASALDQLPASSAEVTVVGRSNVGKSSLLNAIGARKRLAHVSNTPGRTRLLNLFDIKGHGTFVDLPGYGFANAPGEMRASWQAMIETYLLERENLRMVMVLVDGVVGPTKLDIQMLDWLRSCGLPHTIVATKHDKVKPSKRSVRRREVAEKCQLEEADILWTSASKGDGIDKLRGLVVRWLS